MDDSTWSCNQEQGAVEMKVEPSPINMLIIVIAIRTGTIIGLPLQPIVALHQHDCMTKNNIIFIIIITAKDVLELRKVRHQQSESEKFLLL